MMSESRLSGEHATVRSAWVNVIEAALVLLLVLEVSVLCLYFGLMSLVILIGPGGLEPAHEMALAFHVLVAALCLVTLFGVGYCYYGQAPRGVHSADRKVGDFDLVFVPRVQHPAQKLRIGRLKRLPACPARSVAARGNAVPQHNDLQGFTPLKLVNRERKGLRIKLREKPMAVWDRDNINRPRERSSGIGKQWQASSLLSPCAEGEQFRRNRWREPTGSDSELILGRLIAECRQLTTEDLVEGLDGVPRIAR